jgi:hypothetical protein
MKIDQNRVAFVIVTRPGLLLEASEEELSARTDVVVSNIEVENSDVSSD